MFDQFKAMGALAGLMKDKERLREVGERLVRELEEARVRGEAGSGAVRVTATGKARIVKIEIAPAAVSAMASESARPEVEALVVAATNDALEQAQRLMREKAQEAAREFGLPEIPGLDRLLSS